MTIEPIEDSISQIEALAQNYALGQAAIEELAQLKPLFAWAVSCLPRQQLKLSLSEQARLGEFDFQFKAESSGAIVFRSVKTSGN